MDENRPSPGALNTAGPSAARANPAPHGRRKEFTGVVLVPPPQRPEDGPVAPWYLHVRDDDRRVEADFGVTMADPTATEAEAMAHALPVPGPDGARVTVRAERRDGQADPWLYRAELADLPADTAGG